ncbi:hypothetical protein ACSYAY_06655 [Leptospirillum ferriphilum]|jgi:hypothetical protein|uniref:hypothetical protein n=1 Tax=Leptospirillum ferriphilum TaxID=178606 RepID=UPI003EE7C945
MSIFYLEGTEPARNAANEEQELRERLSGMVGHTSFAGKLDPRTAPLPVLQTLEKPITEQFRETAARKGVLVVEEFTDSQGRVCKRYHGDPRSDIEQTIAAPGVTVRLPELSNFEGKPYIRGREPLHVKKAMLLRSHGLENV